MAAAAPPFSRFAELITLPYLTCRGRRCHALKIGSGSDAGRTGVYLLGGVHAREWGSCDILINFIERIEQAYLNDTALSFGTKTFSAAEIRTIVDTLDIVIFPQANPDGRQFSMTNAANSDWRKNRRPALALKGCDGVDINRNYDFLWDFRKHFNPSHLPPLTSTEPCDDGYHGESAFSEPETRNARWIVDKFANTRFFIDLHSYGRDILYCWGDGKDQTENPDMNFMNPAYDTRRGDDRSYQEYIPRDDLAATKSLAAAVRDGIKAVRGIDYHVKPANFLYPSCGTSERLFLQPAFYRSQPGENRVLHSGVGHRISTALSRDAAHHRRGHGRAVGVLPGDRRNAPGSNDGLSPSPTRLRSLPGAQSTCVVYCDYSVCFRSSRADDGGAG